MSSTTFAIPKGPKLPNLNGEFNSLNLIFKTRGKEENDSASLIKDETLLCPPKLIIPIQNYSSRNSCSPSPKNKKISYNHFGGVNQNNRRKNIFAQDHQIQHRNKLPRILKELIKLKNVLKFIKKSRQRSKFRKPDRLKTIHYEIIKDNSHINNNQWERKTISNNKKCLKGHSILYLKMRSEKRSYIENTKLLAKKIYKNIPIIQSNSKEKLVWDIFLFFVIIIELLLISIEISFKENLGEYFGSEMFFDIFPFLMLLANIILEFNTNFYEHGISEVNRKRIAKNYIENNFFLDFLAVISLGSYFFVYEYHPIFKIGFAMIYKTLKKIIDNIQENYRLNGDLFDLFSLILKTLCMAHVLACIWHAIGYYNTEFNASWLTIDGRKDLPVFNRYIMSLYWAFTTMSTVGYGDISPQNIGEMVFCSIVMMIGTFGLGYCVNAVGGILSRIDERSKELNEKMRIIENFMLKSNVNISLRIKVKKYLEFLLKYDNKIIEKENELIGILPNSLRNEILLETNLKFLKDIHILSKNFSDKLLEFLSLNVKPIQYSPSEIIYSQEECENSSLFFIYEGEVDLFLNDAKKNQIFLKTLGKGEHFCEIPFFTNNKAAETAQSRGFSTIFKISRKDFLEFLKDFPNDHEKFCEIRDKYIFSQDFNQHFNKCLSCNEQGHFLDKCPLLNYCPDKEILIERMNFSRPQERSFQLRKYMKSNSFAIKSKTIQGVVKMRFNKKLMRKFFISHKTNVNNEEESLENISEYDKSSDKNDEEIIMERSKSLSFFSECKIPLLKRKFSLEELKNISKKQLGETFYPEKKEINQMLNRNTFDEDFELLAKLNQNNMKNSSLNIPFEKSEKDLSKINNRKLIDEDSNNKTNTSRNKFVNFENNTLLNKSEESKEKIPSPKNFPTIKLRDSSETLNSPKLRPTENLNNKKIPIVETLSSIVFKQGNKLDSNEKIKSQTFKTILKDTVNKFQNLNINISKSHLKEFDSKEIAESSGIKKRKTIIFKNNFQINGKNNHEEENLSHTNNMFIYDFDAKKDFKKYLKNNNASIVLAKPSLTSENYTSAKRKKHKK